MLEMDLKNLIYMKRSYSITNLISIGKANNINISILKVIILIKGLENLNGIQQMNKYIYRLTVKLAFLSVYNEREQMAFRLNAKLLTKSET